MALDEASRSKGDRALARGTPWQEAAGYVGSFARIAWVRDHVEAGDIPRSELYAEWLELWNGSDPDDTDPWVLEVWQEARALNGGPLTDAPLGLPTGTLTVYRGQHAGDPLGIAWSLDRAVARKFAGGMGIRTAMPDGVVITGTVNPADVLGCITERGEAEIAVDPSHVRLLPAVAGRYV